MWPSIFLFNGHTYLQISVPISSLIPNDLHTSNNTIEPTNAQRLNLLFWIFHSLCFRVLCLFEILLVSKPTSQEFTYWKHWRKYYYVLRWLKVKQQQHKKFSFIRVIILPIPSYILYFQIYKRRTKCGIISLSIFYIFYFLVASNYEKQKKNIQKRTHNPFFLTIRNLIWFVFLFFFFVISNELRQML